MKEKNKVEIMKRIIKNMEEKMEKIFETKNKK
jgi:hypothetical protein